MAAYSPASASVSFNNHIICSVTYDQQLDNTQPHGVSNFQCIRLSGTLPDNGFVMRTDVKSYYASIDHLMLLDQLAAHIKDKRVLNLLSRPSDVRRSMTAIPSRAELNNTNVR